MRWTYCCHFVLLLSFILIWLYIFSPDHNKHHVYYSERISQPKLNINRCQYRIKTLLGISLIHPMGRVRQFKDHGDPWVCRKFKILSKPTHSSIIWVMDNPWVNKKVKSGISVRLHVKCSTNFNICTNLLLIHLKNGCIAFINFFHITIVTGGWWFIGEI